MKTKLLAIVIALLTTPTLAEAQEIGCYKLNGQAECAPKFLISCNNTLENIERDHGEVVRSICDERQRQAVACNVLFEDTQRLESQVAKLRRANRRLRQRR